jgi:hypothetical protein
MRTFLLCFLGLTLFTGCKDDDEDDDDGADPRCIAFCEDSNSCPDSSNDPEECRQNCRLIDSINEDSGCGDAFDAVLACEESLADICDDAQAVQCDDPELTWIECIYDYCMEHPTDRNC